ncbi:hypothetical protein A9G05_24025 [Pseudomonas sp. ENNP23]|nr:hypothetical protein A9G05_24025 [Pseudomonas sp. ENNP23]
MTGTSTQAASTAKPDPIVFPADEAPVSKGNEVLCKDTEPGCGQHYYDIAYITGQRRFWLLPKRVAEQLEEAATTLKQQAVGTDKAARMSKIAESGLLDYFLTPKPDSFLEFSDGATDERTRYKQAQAAIEDETAQQVRYRHEWERARSKGDSTAAMRAERNLFRSQRRLKAAQKRVAELDQIAFQRADALGYRRENGVFYTARALQARDAVDRYIAERDKALAHGFVMFDPGSRTVGTAWQHLRDYKALHQKLVETGKVDARALRGVRLNILELEGLMAGYINAVVELADCGIAVPEFALSPDDHYKGTKEFQDYVSLIDKRFKLEQSIKQKHDEWASATANKAAPPSVLFTAQQKEWHQLNEKAESLKAAAEMRVREMMPPRLLLWEPESYRPKPIERLAKGNIPLRELSRAAVGRALNHLSLKHLAQQGASTMGAALKDLKALPKSIAKQADDDPIFSDWLKQQGAHPLDEKGPWFDEDGLFQPDAFFSALDALGFKVDSLNAVDKRQAWGETLQAMIFEDRQLRNLMLFDNSPQAQLVRCLLPAGFSQHAALKVEGPQWNKGLQLTKVQASLEVAAWRGEVTLFNLELPGRSTAKPIQFSYRAYDGTPRTFNLGKLSLNLSAKAWGFAGASLMLARDLTLDQRTGLTSFSGIDVASKTGDLATFDLFVGAQAGCKVTGQLDWFPPPSTLQPAPIPNQIPVNGWRTLAKLDMELVAAVGGGMKGSVRLRLDKGRFLFSVDAALVWGAGLKGFMAFEVGYESVVALLELVRKEIQANNNEDLEWVDQEAMAYLRQLSVTGALAMDVPFLYVRGYAFVKELYDRLTDGGRGAAIARTLLLPEHQRVMQSWVQGLQADALGPLLMALSSHPGLFSDSDHFLQQRAIERCLSWIETEADAVQRFEEAVIRMNRDGARPAQAGLAYCENRLRLNRFMDARVAGVDLDEIDSKVRANYKRLVKRLGQRLLNYCEYRDVPMGPYMGAMEKTIVTYKGPRL